MSPPLRPWRSDASSPNCLSSRRQPVHSHLTYLSEKRCSLYGREVCARPKFSACRNSRRIQYSVQKGEAQTVGLSTFDVVIDIVSPTLPVSDASPLSSSTMATPPRPIHKRDQRTKSLPRARTLSHSLAAQSVRVLQQRHPHESTHVRRQQQRMARRRPTQAPLRLSLRLRNQKENRLMRMIRRSTHANLTRPPPSLIHVRLPPARLGADSIFLSLPSRASGKGPRSEMPLPSLPGPHPQLNQTFPPWRQPVLGVATTP